MQNAEKHTNAKTSCEQIHIIQECILQTDIQNTNIQIAKMHNADKLQNTNTHDLNAKMEAAKSKKGRLSLSGTLWLVNMFGTTKMNSFLSIYPDAHQDLPNQKPQEADIAHFELNSDSMRARHRLHDSNGPQSIYVEMRQVI